MQDKKAKDYLIPG